MIEKIIGCVCIVILGVFVYLLYLCYERDLLECKAYADKYSAEHKVISEECFIKEDNAPWINISTHYLINREEKTDG